MGEAEIKRTLGIDSFRNVSKDKILKFAAMMPDLDTEVAIKIIEQFPVFKEFAAGALNTLERTHSATLIANMHSQDAFHEDLRETREIFKAQLTDDMPSEDRRDINEKLIELAQMSYKKDSENKKSLSENLKTVGVVVGVVAGSVLAALGGKAVIDSLSDSDS
ncbi:hypothetical protein LO762_12515 [Actinocorallia sp. API 0066]|uniref:hypothetical protein n=1 Tax=Actinocorallia sp. API 0066 TaxID=2896846 RepID=UPI001E641D29|nr:hypothetical protein [Actinocorallia sp. API 0066]MCD0450009.1 hypothetical protein [Actinocorallia sp. API 0066]